MRTLLGTHHCVRSVDVMLASAMTHDQSLDNIYLYETRWKEKWKTRTCLPLPVSFIYSYGRVEIRFIVVQASVVWLDGKIDYGFGRRETPNARIALSRQGLSLKRVYLPEGSGNVVFQIIVMIFLATLEFDICRCPICGDKDWLTEKEATLFVD